MAGHPTRRKVDYSTLGQLLAQTNNAVKCRELERAIVAYQNLVALGMEDSSAIIQEIWIENRILKESLGLWDPQSGHRVQRRCSPKAIRYFY